MCAHHSTEIDQMSVWQAATESGKRLLCCFSPLATATALHCMAKAWTVQLQSTGASRSWSARRRVGSLDEARRCRRGSEGEEASKAGSPCADHLRVCRNEIPVRSFAYSLSVANGDTSSLGMHLPRCARSTPYGCATNALVFSVKVLNVNAVKGTRTHGIRTHRQISPLHAEWARNVFASR